MFNYEIALNYWEFFLLILVRIASFVYTAPFFNISSVPQRVKISISVFISILIFMITPDRTIEYTGLLDYAILIIKESVVGLLLGFVCNVCVQAITFAGHIIDTDIGLSMANMYDPTLRTQTSISGTFYYYTVFLLMMVTGLYQFLISAIVDSYSIIPIGEVTINATLYDSFLDVIAGFLIVGIRIALPVFISMMLMNIILGILCRVAPQLNMFAVGIQMKLLFGLAIMFLTIGLLPTVSTMLLNMMKQAVRQIAGGLV